MGERTWLKYLGILAAFSGIGSRFFMWLKQAQSPNSPGGEDIVPEEIPAIQGILTDALNEGFRTNNVPLIAELRLTYIGEE